MIFQSDFPCMAASTASIVICTIPRYIIDYIAAHYGNVTSNVCFFSQPFRISKKKKIVKIKNKKHIFFKISFFKKKMIFYINFILTTVQEYDILI